MSNRVDRVLVDYRRMPVALAGLLAMVIVSGCGSTSPEHKQALAKIQDIGGRVNIKRGGYEVDFTRTTVENDDLAHLKQIANLKNIDLQGTRISDAGLLHLREITTLEIVDLRRTKATLEAVDELRKALPKARIEH